MHEDISMNIIIQQCTMNSRLQSSPEVESGSEVDSPSERTKKSKDRKAGLSPRRESPLPRRHSSPLPPSAGSADADSGREGCYGEERWRAAGKKQSKKT